MFYEKKCVRAIEPFIGELYGDYLYIEATKSKGRNDLLEDSIKRGIKGNSPRNACIQRWICCS